MSENTALLLVRTLTERSTAVRRFLDVGAVLATGVLPAPRHSANATNAATAMLRWGSIGFGVNVYLRSGAEAPDLGEGEPTPRVVIQEHGNNPAVLPWTPYRTPTGDHVLVVENSKDAERTMVTFIDYVLSLAKFPDEDGHFWTLPR